MITCQNARDLFDRYLDGELSPTLQTELHAHCLQCLSCQNELAMLETCGDVIALDRSEPRLSDSFTDRVLAARRGQLVRPPRRWPLVLARAGLPLAAAASITLAILFTMPADNARTITAGAKVAQPQEVQNFLIPDGGASRSKEALKELKMTPKVASTGFINELLTPLIEQSRMTMERTLRGTEDLKFLIQRGFIDGNQPLQELWQATQGEIPSLETSESAGAPLKWWETPMVVPLEPAEQEPLEAL